MPNPRDALTQQELLRSNLTKPEYVRFLHYFAQSAFSKGGMPMAVDEDGKPSGGGLADLQIRALEMADTYYVSADMSDVIEYASLGLDDLDRFSHDLWPTDFGFLWLQKAIEVKDVWGHDMPFKALVWSRQSVKGQPGTVVYLYTDLDDPNDHLGSSMTQQKRDEVGASFGRMHLCHILLLADDMRVGPMQWTPPEEYAKYAPDDATPLAETSVNNDRFMLALLMMLGQTITVSTKHNLRPANPKHARKMKVPGLVTVITLRRASNGDEHEGGQERAGYAYRFPVRGHWRSQACGPHHPLAQQIGPGRYRARIYIHWFMKGDPDLPIHLSKKIQSLTR